LEYGVGDNPGSWNLLAESNNPIENGTLHNWTIPNLPNGIITLRLTLIGEHTEIDERIRLNLSLPTPTPPPVTPTDTPPPTATPTIFIPPTATETPTLTPTETPTP
ncbi:MAG TPA: hypothetical protein PLX90_08845, partial [Anaerolineales bacterium]|nr:hypothetical protein [Anaerolineales bacterium]